MPKVKFTQIACFDAVSEDGHYESLYALDADGVVWKWHGDFWKPLVSPPGFEPPEKLTDAPEGGK